MRLLLTTSGRLPKGSVAKSVPLGLTTASHLEWMASALRSRLTEPHASRRNSLLLINDSGDHLCCMADRYPVRAKGGRKELHHIISKNFESEGVALPKNEYSQIKSGKACGGKSGMCFLKYLNLLMDAKFVFSPPGIGKKNLVSKSSPLHPFIYSPLLLLKDMTVGEPGKFFTPAQFLWSCISAVSTTHSLTYPSSLLSVRSKSPHPF